MRIEGYSLTAAVILLLVSATVGLASGVAYHPVAPSSHFPPHPSPSVNLSFPIRFSTSGLPTGQLWSVALNGVRYGTSGSETNVSLANGTYHYVVRGPVGYNALPAKGNVSVAGVPTDVLANVTGYGNVQGVLVDSLNNRIYVPESTNDTLSVLNATNYKLVAAVAIGSYGMPPILGTNGSFVYIPNYNSANISVLNTTSNKIAATLKVGGYPEAGELDPANGRIYVPNWGTNSIDVIASVNYTLLKPIPTNGTPVSVTVLPDRGEIWVLCDSAPPAVIDIVNVSTGTVVKYFASYSYLLQGAAYVPSVNRIFVADYHNGRFLVYNATSAAFITKFYTPGLSAPEMPVLDTSNGMVYFSSTPDGTYGILDPQTDSFVRNVSIIAHPSEITYDSSTGDLWIPFYFGTTLQEFDGNPLTISATFSPATPSWERIGSGHKGGTPDLIDPHLAFDGRDGYFVLFGVGVSSNSSLISETWKFEGGRWNQLNLTTAPGPRADETMAYDPSDGYVVLFGGEYPVPGNGQCPCAGLGETWKFSGGNWTNITTLASPRGEIGAAMTYDVRDMYLLLFGGLTTTRFALNDTWKFTAGVWTQLFPTASPTARFGAAVSFDPSSRSVVMVGGGQTSASTGTWEFASGVWSNVTTPSPPPALGRGSMLVYDKSCGCLVITGGSLSQSGAAFNQTWIYVSGSWSFWFQGSATIPGLKGALALDPKSGEILLYIGGVKHSSSWMLT